MLIIPFLNPVFYEIGLPFFKRHVLKISSFYIRMYTQNIVKYARIYLAYVANPKIV